MKIKSVEEAVKVLEENAVIQAETFENGNNKLGNRCFLKIMKSIVYLYQHDALDSLLPLLESDKPGARYASAFALLPVAEEKSKAVLLELSNGNYGFLSINSEICLLRWKNGEIIFPYQEGFHW